MIIENTFDKLKLISELKEIHIELVEVYKKIFDYKYRTNADFEAFIDKEYKENKISDGEQQVWNDNFCHRASYTLLNKILFIRICEDKGFMLNPEDYVAGEPKDPHIGKKLSRIGLQKWANLVTNYTLGELVKLAFLDMKKSYGNIALYKDDKYEMLTPTTEELSLKYLDGDEEAQKLVLQFENALGNIVEKLDTNNYNFNSTDGNILGDVYEKFMDRETRKAIGQFYTPEFVIEYILNNTVAKADVVENPFVSVADISCGSGHFLIMAYDILREKFINNLELLRDKYADEVYTLKKNGKVVELTGKGYWKEEHIHYHLLKHCIYGADIDSFAVQLTTINLLLKDLDNFTDELNIVECDSLIKWEKDYDWKELKQQLGEEFETIEYTQTNLIGEEEKIVVTSKKELFELRYKDIIGVERVEMVDRERAQELINLCEFWDCKFDYAIGNPPYGSRKRIDESKKIYYGNKYFEEGDYDTYMFFIWRSIELCNLKIGFITPNGYFTNIYNNKLRTFILNNTHLEEIVNLKSNVFEDANVDTVITIFNNKEIDKEQILIKAIEKFNTSIYDSQFNNFSIYYSEILKDPNKMIYINSKEGLELEKILFRNSKKLRDIAYCGQGVIVYGTKEESRRGGYLEVTSETGLWKKTLKGRDIGDFYIEWKGLKVKYGNWLRRSRNEEHLKSNKILIQRLRNQKLSRRLVCALDEEGYYVLNNLNYVISENKDYDLIYLLGILNSNLLNYYYATKYTDVNIKEEYIRNLPIKKVNSKSEEIIQVVDKINRLRKYNFKKNIVDSLITKTFTEEKLSNIIKNSLEINALLNENLVLLNMLIYNLYEVDIDIIQDAEVHVLGYLSLERKELFLDFLELSFEDANSALNKIKIDSYKELVKYLSKDELYERHVINNEPLEQIATSYNCELFTLIYYMEQVIQSNPSQIWDIINFSEIYQAINEYISIKCTTLLRDNIEVTDISQIKDWFVNNDCNYKIILKIFRKDNHTKQVIDLFKDALKGDMYTWNTYRKAKTEGKNDKVFIKYDANNYGLAEWSDEIHKNYFLDAIEEYTVNNPNEKKAKDILKLFEDLDIEDKQDYIEVIEEKIRKTFK
ncbi:N-6 DNA methylase [Tissierella pigra]|uniref:site-specific DNA-methyltransferase (adenine-specific) n=1 Tax=Tissierella pigra TaxID=2607614 RepID=A0A6N7XM54_9FIRM|nr:N-6 DNA methylase [Tissierella pigra]MBU5425701.1 N-6 DNA methylase [Tissierella pigra]MSU01862.1 N-6 DNA methylase [Tissierella pigra]